MPGALLAACSNKGNHGRDSERSLVADLPQYLTRKHNRDPSEGVELALRRSFFGLVALVLLAGLLNVFGQRPTESLAAASRGRSTRLRA